MSMDTLEFLVDMRRELKADAIRLEEKLDKNNKALTKKLDDTLVILNNHETRLVIVEGTRKNIRWLGGTLIAGAVAAAYDFFSNHAHRFVGR